MRRGAGPLALVGVIAVAVLGGCSQGQQGEARPAEDAAGPSPGASSTTEPSPSPGTTPSIPDRPEELPLDGVKACALFTDAQLAQLKLDRKRERTAQDSQYRGMAECYLDANSPPFDSYVATAVTNEGFEAWLTGKRNVEAKPGSVAGFPAATYWIRGAGGRDVDACDTSVGVADGQQLMVSSDNDSGRSFTLEQLCQRAEQAAALAVQTLRTLR